MFHDPTSQKYFCCAVWGGKVCANINTHTVSSLKQEDFNITTRSPPTRKTVLSIISSKYSIRGTHATKSSYTNHHIHSRASPFGPIFLLPPSIRFQPQHLLPTLAQLRGTAISQNTPFLLFHSLPPTIPTYQHSKSNETSPRHTRPDKNG